MRLQKFLAHAGVASRRASEAMIADGRVSINGEVVDVLGRQVDPDRDLVAVDGREVLAPGSAHVYVALNKPAGVVSTTSDPEGRPTVSRLVQVGQRVYPVGRLDVDSEGLILLTDDGDLTFRLTQARFGIEKEYHALVSGCVSAEGVGLLVRGIDLEDGPARAVRAESLKVTEAATWLRVVLVEGRQRQVRRMLAALGYDTLRLRRERIGPLVLGDLPVGRWRHLNRSEVAAVWGRGPVPQRGVRE